MMALRREAETELHYYILFVQIMLDDVFCKGTETSITACKNRGWRQSDCNHYEDASVRCHVPALQGHEVCDMEKALRLTPLGWPVSSSC